MKLLATVSSADLKASQHEDGDTLLDRTMVLYGSNLGNANTHVTTNLPVLFAGGGFKHGQHLAFDRERNYPLPNLFVSMLQRLGIEADRFAIEHRHDARPGVGVSCELLWRQRNQHLTMGYAKDGEIRTSPTTPTGNGGMARRLAAAGLLAWAFCGLSAAPITAQRPPHLPHHPPQRRCRRLRTQPEMQGSPSAIDCGSRPSSSRSGQNR